MAWKSTPQRARWYGELIITGEDGDTTDVYAYSAAQEEPDPAEILPASERWRIIEASVKPTLNS